MSKSYEDIRETLLGNKLDGLFGQGASDDEIATAEREFGVDLPQSYKMFLHEYGWGYFGSLEVICGLGSDIPAEWEAGASLLRVVPDERKGQLRFPNSLIPFCQNGAGDWYALDCSVVTDNESPVVFVPHETVAREGFLTEPSSDSFADWIHAKLSENAVA
jgi:hypothetical protein